MSELGRVLANRDGKLLGDSGTTTKEKLMLLIGSVPCGGEEHVAACPNRIMGCCGQSVKMDFCALGHMADWLIANGVVVQEKGEWEPLGQRTCGSGGGRNYTHYCNRCGQHGYDDYSLCPNCGADMRKGENE